MYGPTLLFGYGLVFIVRVREGHVPDDGCNLVRGFGIDSL